MKVTDEQAQPLPGRVLPTRAKGARPDCFDDGGVTDALMAITTSLAAEVWALRERIDSLESVLAADGTIEHGAVEAHRPDDAAAAASDTEASAFVGRVYRVFEEMREEIRSGDTIDGYLSVVERASRENPGIHGNRHEGIGGHSG